MLALAAQILESKVVSISDPRGVNYPTPRRRAVRRGAKGRHPADRPPLPMPPGLSAGRLSRNGP
jgi:hypothetical protein